MTAKIGVTDRPVQVLGGWYGHAFVADVLGGSQAAIRDFEQHDQQQAEQHSQCAAKDCESAYLEAAMG